ncbi:hypothetical protein DKX38_005065 [Salix brachista]|uniref:Cysteine proteinase inhibitor n=1 Tax=Salix brachista TaxID=2182728 RepID=A0A5N5NET5_9ROSI|nr:hypothetical protein DKX38_005065 [Salix brachista]
MISPAIISALLTLAVVLAVTTTPLISVSGGFCPDKMATLGGVHDSQSSQNSAEIDSLARFAVDEHNKKGNAILEFARVVKAKEQVVAGTMHHLTIEAIEGGKKKMYEAKVWVKPWLNFKELNEFKDAGDVPVFTSSDLGAKREATSSYNVGKWFTLHRTFRKLMSQLLYRHARGWQAVPVHDPSVQDAANHALKSIQQKSNSLSPYELQEVVHANAEVEDESARFDMLLRVKRGSTEEKFKIVKVHKLSHIVSKSTTNGVREWHHRRCRIGGEIQNQPFTWEMDSAYPRFPPKASEWSSPAVSCLSLSPCLLIG